MAYMRIHCDNCGRSWEVYGYNWKEDRARECPHCSCRITRDIWEKEALPVFRAVDDANAKMYRESVANHTPLFSFDVIADHLYQVRGPIGGPEEEPTGDRGGKATLEEMLARFSAFLREQG